MEAAVLDLYFTWRNSCVQTSRPFFIKSGNCWCIEKMIAGLTVQLWRSPETLLQQPLTFFFNGHFYNCHLNEWTNEWISGWIHLTQFCLRLHDREIDYQLQIQNLLGSLNENVNNLSRNSFSILAALDLGGSVRPHVLHVIGGKYWTHKHRPFNNATHPCSKFH